MNTLARPLLAWCAALALAFGLGACGGGGGGVSVNTGSSTGTGTSTSTVTPSTPPTATSSTVTTGTNTSGLFLTGIAYPLALNNSVHVPAGTRIAMPDGTVATLHAVTTAINVPGGSVITVPATATGPANILLTTLPSLPYTLATALPTITTVAGSPTAAGSPIDGIGTAARFWGGGHLAVSATGQLFVSDGASLRQVSAFGVVTTRVPAYLPYDWEGIAIDAAGTVYGSGTSWAPPPNNFGASIQSMDSSGTLKTVVDNWTVSPTFSYQGYGGLAVDARGNLYLTDAPRHRIMKFSASGVVSVFAGNGVAGAADGTTASATFNNPTDLALDGSGNLYVSDTGNGAIRKIAPSGIVTTLSLQANPGAISSSPSGTVYFLAGSPRTLHRLPPDLSYTLSLPLAGITDGLTGLAADGFGNVYVGTAGTGAQIFRLKF